MGNFTCFDKCNVATCTGEKKIKRKFKIMKLEIYFHFQIILATYLSAKFVSGNLEPNKLLIIKRKQLYATEL